MADVMPEYMDLIGRIEAIRTGRPLDQELRYELRQLGKSGLKLPLTTHGLTGRLRPDSLGRHGRMQIRRWVSDRVGPGPRPADRVIATRKSSVEATAARHSGKVSKKRGDLQLLGRVSPAVSPCHAESLQCLPVDLRISS